MEMTRNRRSAWQQWLLGAAALAVALVVGELVCRLALPRPGFVAVSGNSFPGAIEPHPTRLYQLVPNFSGVVRRGTFGEMRFATNAEGLRERPLSVVRRARVRILSIGDSFTFGTGINQEDTWPTQLERLLNRRAADSDAIAVINAGVPAYGFTQLRDLTEEILPKVDPQIMLLGVYTGGFDRMNDPFTALGDFVIRRSQRPSASRAVPDGFVISRITREPATSIDLWLEAHTYLGAYLFEAANEVRGRIAQLFSPAKARATFPKPNAADSARALRAGLDEIRRIVQDATSRGVTTLVVLAPGFDRENRIFPDQKLVADSVRKFCEQERMPFFDPTAALEASGVALRVRPEDIHLSAPANKLVADYIAAKLISLRQPDLDRALAQRAPGLARPSESHPASRSQ